MEGLRKSCSVELRFHKSGGGATDLVLRQTDTLFLTFHRPPSRVAALFPRRQLLVYLKDLFTRLPSAKITEIKQFTPRASAAATAMEKWIAQAA